MTLVGGGPSGAPDFVREDGVLAFVDIAQVKLDSGVVLPRVRMAYETWGELNADGSNAVLIEHALTGDTHLTRGRAREHAPEIERTRAEAPGWCENLVGPGKVIDTEKYFVVAINMLGGCYGSTGPATPAPPSVDPAGKPWGPRFPFVTVRDGVRAEAAVADALGIRQWRLVMGGSMGGARALEWAATFPDRVRACGVIASCAASSAEQIAWGQAQSLALRQDPAFASGYYYDGEFPMAGLGLARRIAHITYRSAAELQTRFSRDPQPGESVLGTAVGDRGRYKVESYLDYQASKLADRFDANSYLTLNEALMSHDVARGRGTLREALAGTTCDWLVAAVDSDRLYYPYESDALCEALPGDVVRHTIHSDSGHDGFLIEDGQLGELVRQTVLRD
ncbi:homoserine O-acetyltransferase [Kocuria coralli]|uniref:Homoserine O-acetyltransferase n=1 Tax=Kocuria coralli TaxID=1461025 RepID=A0A5J5KY97_9MICC|nr:homoserine O-acetyltransferase [Kocuria coralli]KAA9393796.1 homoserine O-acetyltransferase [Kocuria coralli]